MSQGWQKGRAGRCRLGKPRASQQRKAPTGQGPACLRVGRWAAKAGPRQGDTLGQGWARRTLWLPAQLRGKMGRLKGEEKARVKIPWQRGPAYSKAAYSKAGPLGKHPSSAPGV